MGKNQAEKNSKVSKGIYFLMIQTDDATEVKKLILH